MQQNLDTGTRGNNLTGDDLNEAAVKIEANFTELYGIKLESVVAGTGISIDNTDPINPIINGQLLISNTSDLTNDGSDGTSTYVENDELGALATLSTVNTAQIEDGSITLAKHSTAAANTLRGNNTGSAATPTDLTAAEVRALLNVADGAAGNQTLSIFGNDLTISGGNTITLPTGGSVTFDETPVNGSTNAVRSNGIFDALVDIDSYASLNSIDGDKLSDLTVSTAKLADSSITQVKIAANSIGVNQIDNTTSGIAPSVGQVPSYNGTDFTWINTSGGLSQSTGSYTPVASGATSGTHTASTALGEWFRIGDIVHVRIRMAVVNGSSSGVFQVSLPFAGRALNMFDQLNCTVTGSSSSFNSVQGEVNGSQIFFTLDGGLGTLLSETFTNGNIRISGTFIANV